MPEVIQTYLDTDDFNEVREIQKNLLKYYEEDFSKHAPRDVIPRIMMHNIILLYHFLLMVIH